VTASQETGSAIARWVGRARSLARSTGGLRDVGRYTQQLGLVLVVVVLAIIFQANNSVFLSQANLLELLRSGTLYFIVGCPLTLVVVAGGLDFSVGAVYALGAVVTGMLITHGVAWPLAVLLGAALGVVLGLINAAIAIYLGVPPLIATLGMFFSASGLAVVMTNGADVFGFPKAFIRLGSEEIDRVPILIVYAVVVGLIFHVLLEKTVFGYNIRATGGSRSAASANGIRVNRLDLTLYAASGALAALAGIVNSARLSAASPEAGGTGLTFEVLTAVIIGGTSLFGGVGTIAGTALGVLLFAEINNGLTVINLNPLYQNVFVGVILVVAVAVDQLRRRRRFRAGK
jgi:ribose transport system permease protein